MYGTTLIIWYGSELFEELLYLPLKDVADQLLSA